MLTEDTEEHERIKKMLKMRQCQPKYKNRKLLREAILKNVK